MPSARAIIEAESARFRKELTAGGFGQWVERSIKWRAPFAPVAGTLYLQHKRDPGLQLTVTPMTPGATGDSNWTAELRSNQPGMPVTHSSCRFYAYTREIAVSEASDMLKYFIARHFKERGEA